MLEISKPIRTSTSLFLSNFLSGKTFVGKPSSTPTRRTISDLLVQADGSAFRGGRSVAWITAEVLSRISRFSEEIVR